MLRVRSLLFVLALLAALLAGGLFTTAAWRYQASQTRAESAAGLIAAPSPLAQAPGAPTAMATQAPVAAQPNAASGQLIFQQSCDACHPDRQQGAGPALQGRTLQTKYPDDAALKRLITNGRGIMPPFRQLSSGQLDDLLAYIKS